MAGSVGYKQIMLAREVNFILFLQKKFPEHIVLDKKSKVYIHPEHDSLKYYDKGYYRFSTNEGGDSIRFMTDFLGKTFPEAVKELCQFAEENNIEISEQPKKQVESLPGIYNIVGNLMYDSINSVNAEKYPPVLPKKYKDNDRVTAYLAFNRSLDRNFITKLIDDGLLYEDINHNAVFVNPRTPGDEFAYLRNCIGIPYQRIIGQGMKYWYFTVGENPENLENVFVTESPIDAISLYELTKHKEGVYVGMCGLKPNVVEQIIADFPNHTIKLGVDWDDAGKKFINTYAPVFRKKAKLVILKPTPEREKLGKDWNDVVVAEDSTKYGNGG